MHKIFHVNGLHKKLKYDYLFGKLSSLKKKKSKKKKHS